MILPVRGFDGPVGKSGRVQVSTNQRPQAPVASSSTSSPIAKPSSAPVAKATQVPAANGVVASFQTKVTASTPAPVIDKPVAYSPATVIRRTSQNLAPSQSASLRSTRQVRPAKGSFDGPVGRGSMGQSKGVDTRMPLHNTSKGGTGTASHPSSVATPRLQPSASPASSAPNNLRAKDTGTKGSPGPGGLSMVAENTAAWSQRLDSALSKAASAGSQPVSSSGRLPAGADSPGQATLSVKPETKRVSFDPDTIGPAISSGTSSGGAIGVGVPTSGAKPVGTSSGGAIGVDTPTSRAKSVGTSSGGELGAGTLSNTPEYGMCYPPSDSLQDSPAMQVPKAAGTPSPEAATKTLPGDEKVILHQNGEISFLSSEKVAVAAEKYGESTMTEFNYWSAYAARAGLNYFGTALLQATGVTVLKAVPLKQAEVINSVGAWAAQAAQDRFDLLSIPPVGTREVLYQREVAPGKYEKIRAVVSPDGELSVPEGGWTPLN